MPSFFCSLDLRGSYHDGRAMIRGGDDGDAVGLARARLLG